jgi:hypothetical protein
MPAERTVSQDSLATIIFHGDRLWKKKVLNPFATILYGAGHKKNAKR